MQLGRKGEDFVARFLENKNFKILHRNLRTPYGEVDLVARHEETIFVFEIKTRRHGLKNEYQFRGILGWTQRKRLERASQWLWLKYRHQCRSFRSALLVVTDCGIKWINLPLLYDRA
jgi:Holliday junction resolvase-like predicted endonuclease